MSNAYIHVNVFLLFPSRPVAMILSLAPSAVMVPLGGSWLLIDNNESSA